MLKRYSVAVGAIFSIVAQSAGAVSINFDYSFDGGFFSGSNIGRRSILDAAGSYLGNLLTDQLTAITSDSTNHFNADFSRPDTGSLTTLTDYNVASNALTVFVGGRVLSTGTLGEGGPGGYSASGSLDYFTAITQRGQTNPAANDPTNHIKATDFAPWGGAITFNNTSNWYFDSNPSTTESFSGNDFFSVALHELTHVLGFGTSDSWNNLIAANGSSFTGSNSDAAYGGKVPLSPDKGHWQEGTQSSVGGVIQEAMMDPSLLTGTRKLPTSLDLAGLKDVGWQVGVAAVPLPSAVWLFGTALLGLAGTARQKRKR